MSTPYIRLRRMVDYDLANNRRPLTPLLSLLPVVLIQVILQQQSSIAWFLTATAGFVWLAFVGWRATRLFKAFTLKSDRQYDQTGKFTLPPEYAATESATKAHRRRKNDH